MMDAQLHPTLSAIYKVQGYFVRAGWLLLVVALFWQPATSLAFGVIMILCALYAYLVLAGKKYAEDGKGLDVKSFFTIEGVIAMLRDPKSAFIAWTHILVFDMFAGLIIVMSAQPQGITPFVVIPCLIGTLMFGPFGLLVYFGLALLISGQMPLGLAGF